MADELFVTMTEPDKPPRRIVLEGVLEFGRECDGEVVSDGEVSRQHLKLLPSPTGLKVVDLGSSNGTFVNEVRISEPTLLKPGDIVRLGRTELAVGDPPKAGRSTVAPIPTQPSSQTMTTMTTAAESEAPATARPTGTSRAPVPTPTPGPAARPAGGRPAAGRPAPAASPAVAAVAADVKPKFFGTIMAMVRRVLVLEQREPLPVLRAVLVGAFFLVALAGALKQVDANALELKSVAVVFPLAVLLAVSGISRASYLAREVQFGFVDRLLLSTSRQLPLLIGCMVADFVVGVIVAVPLIVVGLALGLHVAAGIGGLAVIVILAAAWGAVYSGFWYAISFGAANPAQGWWEYGVAFPLLLLSPALAPRSAMSPWLAHVAAFNPVTYLIDAVRSLQSDGWKAGALIKAASSVVGIGVAVLVVGSLVFRSRVGTSMASRTPGPPPKAKSPEQSEADMLRAALESERQARLRLEERLAKG